MNRIDSHSNCRNISIVNRQALYAHLGRNSKAGLSGRPPRSQMGIIATSRLYSIKGRLFAFLPRLLDRDKFYLAADANLLADLLLSRIKRLAIEWGLRPGNPTVFFMVDSHLLVPGTEAAEGSG